MPGARRPRRAPKLQFGASAADANAKGPRDSTRARAPVRPRRTPWLARAFASVVAVLAWRPRPRSRRPSRGAAGSAPPVSLRRCAESVTDGGVWRSDSECTRAVPLAMPGGAHGPGRGNGCHRPSLPPRRVREDRVPDRGRDAVGRGVGPLVRRHGSVGAVEAEGAAGRPGDIPPVSYRERNGGISARIS